MRSHPMVLSVFVLALLSCFALRRTKAQQPVPARRGISVDDIFELRDVSDPQITADGKWVAYTVSTMSLKEDKTETRIWMVPTLGGDPNRDDRPEGILIASTMEPGWQLFGVFFPNVAKARRRFGC